MCNVLDVNRAAYSYWYKKGKTSSEKQIEFYQKIIKIYAKNKGIYGAPKIAAELNNIGVECSVATVSRGMKTLGIRSIVAERFTKRKSSMSAEERQRIVNLIKELVIDGINQVWTTDITYIKTASEGNFYLITYIDAYSRRVVAWDLKRQQKSSDMIDVLKQAIKQRNFFARLDNTLRQGIANEVKRIPRFSCKAQDNSELHIAGSFL